MNPVLSNAFLCRRCFFFYVASCLCVSTVDGGGPCWRLCFCLCLCCLCLSFSLSFYHIRVFSTADGGWVPAGGGVPSSFCLQSPKTDCGRKAFSQYCRQPAKRGTKARGIKILRELGSAAGKSFDIRRYQMSPFSPALELKTFGNFFG